MRCRSVQSSNCVLLGPQRKHLSGPPGLFKSRPDDGHGFPGSIGAGHSKVVVVEASTWTEARRGERWWLAARRGGPPGARRRGAAALGRAVGEAPLSALPRPVRQVAAARGGAGGDLAGAAGLAGRGVQGGGSRRVDRLVARAAVLAAAPDREQQPVRGAGGGAGCELGVAGAGVEPAAAVAGHARRARVPGGAGGDLRGPVAVRGHVLPGVELACAGAHAGLFARTGRDGALARARPAEGGVRVRDGDGRGGGAAPRRAARRVAAGGRGVGAGRARAAQPACLSGGHGGLPQGARPALRAGLLRDDHDRRTAGGLPGGERVRRVRRTAGPGAVGGGGLVLQSEPAALHRAGAVHLPLHPVVAGARRTGPGAGGVDASAQRRGGAGGAGREGRARRLEAHRRRAPDDGRRGRARHRAGARSGPSGRQDQRDPGGCAS